MMEDLFLHNLTAPKSLVEPHKERQQAQAVGLYYSPMLVELVSEMAGPRALQNRVSNRHIVTGCFATL